MTDDRIHLVVLYGGQSAEHDVSCITAAHVLAAIDPARYRLSPVGIATDGTWTLNSDIVGAVRRGDPIGDRVPIGGEETSPSEALDERTVVLPLLHGPMGEDGTIQGLLELADVPYAGSGVLGSAVAMDKAMTKQVLAAHDIAQARHVAVAAHEVSPTVLDRIGSELGYPCFVKPANMGSSVGVSKAANPTELATAVELALTYDEWLIVEEAVVGREIEVAVIGNHDLFVSVPGEIVVGDEFYSYDDKYVNDVSTAVIPAELSPAETERVRQLAEQVFRAVRAEGLARCDFFLHHERGFLCNEINTMPGFTPISMFPKLLMASGWDYAEIVDHLVELAIERHGRRRRTTVNISTKSAGSQAQTAER